MGVGGSSQLWTTLSGEMIRTSGRSGREEPGQGFAGDPHEKSR